MWLAANLFPQDQGLRCPVHICGLLPATLGSHGLDDNDASSGIRGRLLPSRQFETSWDQGADFTLRL